MPKKVQVDDTYGAVEFDNRDSNAHCVKKTLDVLDKSMQKMVASVTNIGGAFEGIARSYVDVTSVAMATKSYSKIPVSAETRRELIGTAKLFVTDMQNMREGDAMKFYQVKVHRQILDRMRPLRDLAKQTTVAGRHTKDALKKYEKKLQIVENKVKKYTNKNKPISTSKHYERQLKECTEAHDDWHTKLLLFNEKYDELMATIEKVSGDTLDQFLDINSFMLQSMLTTIREFAPNAVQTYPTISNVLTSAIHNNMSIASEDEAIPRTKVSRVDRSARQGPQARVSEPCPVGRLTVSCAPEAPALTSSPQQPPNGDPYSLDHRFLTPDLSDSELVPTLVNPDRSPEPRLKCPPAAEVMATAPTDEVLDDADCRTNTPTSKEAVSLSPSAQCP